MEELACKRRSSPRTESRSCLLNSTAGQLEQVAAAVENAEVANQAAPVLLLRRQNELCGPGIFAVAPKDQRALTLLPSGPRSFGSEVLWLKGRRGQRLMTGGTKHHNAKRLTDNWRSDSRVALTNLLSPVPSESLLQKILSAVYRWPVFRLRFVA
jgi:hypothetical protein